MQWYLKQNGELITDTCYLNGMLTILLFFIHFFMYGKDMEDNLPFIDNPNRRGRPPPQSHASAAQYENELQYVRN